MKQRMYNTFSRIFKNHVIAKVLSEVGYELLMAYYMVARNFVKSRKKKIYDASKVREELLREYPIENMESEIINLPTNEHVDLSIIMPAYNVEKYIKEAIDSVLNQKTKYNYELIIVNDGATDNTKKIIQSIESDKIKYIEQKNQGLSGARNTGINNAVGKYITFMDSDDLLEDGSIEIMMDALINNKADIVVGSYAMFMDINHKQKCLNEPKIIENNPEQAVCNHGYAWGKIFKRKMFNNIRFPMRKWYEDTIICNVLFRMSCKMVVLSEIVYDYRINYGGISRTARGSIKSLDHYWVMEDAIKQAEKNNIENDQVLYALAFGHLSSLLYRRVSNLDDKVIEDVFVLACELINNIKPSEYEVKGRIINKDIQYAFETYNYKLWKLASFIV
ncbi:MAG: glycosyltransferase family 2 protein [Eubacterium sp.]|nr:glycosyltransferase family 2 protein [Eubacterium sp.]